MSNEQPAKVMRYCSLQHGHHIAHPAVSECDSNASDECFVLACVFDALTADYAAFELANTELVTELERIKSEMAGVYEMDMNDQHRQVRELRAERDALRADNAALVREIEDYRGPQDDENSAIERLGRIARLPHAGTALLEEIAVLKEKYQNLVEWYDDYNGTPCEQIRHKQQVEELTALVTALVGALEKAINLLNKQTYRPLDHEDDIVEIMQMQALLASPEVAKWKKT